MAVNIDELEVQTEPSAPAPQAAPQAAAAQPQLDFTAEMEKFRERELRLRAD